MILLRVWLVGCRTAMSYCKPIQDAGLHAGLRAKGLRRSSQGDGWFELQKAAVKRRIMPGHVIFLKYAGDFCPLWEAHCGGSGDVSQACGERSVAGGYFSTGV